MSGTQPAGVDVMTSEDTALYNAMKEGDGAGAAAAGEPAIEIVPGEADEGGAAAEGAADGQPGAGGQGSNQPANRPVPYSRFQESVEARRAAEDRYRALEVTTAAKEATVQARLDMLMAAIQTGAAGPALGAAGAQPAAPVIPDIAVDPVGHFQGKLAEAMSVVDQLKQRLDGNDQQQRQRLEVEALRSWGVASERQFAQSTPDYFDATAFLRQKRHELLITAGETDPARREQAINNDVHQIAVLARQRNADLGKTLYDLAVGHGYVAKTAARGAAPAGGALPSMADGLKTDAAGGLTVDAAATAQARATLGRANAAGLGGVAGTPPGIRLTADQVSNMSDADFARIVGGIEKRGGKEALKALLGG